MDGFNNASATRIAREAGLSRSGFYEHFGSVDELSHFVLESLLAETTALDLRARLAPGEDKKSLPEYAVEVLLRSIQESRDFYQHILLSDRSGGAVVWAMERFTQSAREVITVIRADQSAGQRDLYAAAIGGTVLGMVMHYLRENDQRPAPELAREVVSMMPEWMYPGSQHPAERPATRRQPAS